ncbi:hypothetical protein CVT26_001304, partial [Gymnopilus dilepis]
TPKRDQQPVALCVVDPVLPSTTHLPPPSSSFAVFAPPSNEDVGILQGGCGVEVVEGGPMVWEAHQKSASENPARRRRHGPRDLPAPSSLGKTSRRRGRDPNSAHQRSLANAEPHFPRIEERVVGGGSALWCPAGVVAAAVAASPHPLSCHQS